MNISNIHDCYGCGVCATACGQNIINIALNSDGFYEPNIINFEKCTDCGICTDVCAFIHNDLALKGRNSHCYAAWSKDMLVRRKCSSGGAGFEIGKYLIGLGYKVCGVRYNTEENIAEHYIATTVEDLVQSIGSKYIQSFTVDGFNAIDRKGKYLVTGTPCQIDSFRRYIQKFRCEDNFILMDFFCHGVPSMILWKKYLRWAEAKVGKITYVSWRNKQTGWHDSWSMGIDGEAHGENINWHDNYNQIIREKKSYLSSRLSQGDRFYRLFLSDSCLGKQCYDSCKYKIEQSSADIRICDLWGKTYQHNEDGVSGAITFTERGKRILRNCNCELIEHGIDVISECQMAINSKRTRIYHKLMAELRNPDTTIESIYARYLKLTRVQRNINRLKNPISTLKNILKKL